MQTSVNPTVCPCVCVQFRKIQKIFPKTLLWHCVVGANNSSQEALSDHEQLFAWIHSQIHWIVCQKAVNVGQYCHILNSNIGISVIFTSVTLTCLDQYTPCHWICNSSNPKTRTIATSPNNCSLFSKSDYWSTLGIQWEQNELYKWAWCYRLRVGMELVLGSRGI